MDLSEGVFRGDVGPSWGMIEISQERAGSLAQGKLRIVLSSCQILSRLLNCPPFACFD